MDRKPLASPGEVAAYLGGMSEVTLKTWRYNRTGPKWVKVGRHVRYRWAEVDAWLDRNAVGNGPGAA